MTHFFPDFLYPFHDFVVVNFSVLLPPNLTQMFPLSLFGIYMKRNRGKQVRSTKGCCVGIHNGLNII